jgi:hypothetical protein
MADDPARRAIFEQLQRDMLDTYGEERAADPRVKNILEATATSVWRVGQELLEPLGPEPLPTHD